MENEKKTWRDRTEELKGWWRYKKLKMAEFYRENPQLVHAAISAAGVVTVALIKECAKAHKRNEEEELKELWVYDRSAGHYYKTRRPLTNSERLEVDRRHSNGERIGEILMDMRLLK